MCTAYPGGYLGGGYAPPTGSVRCLYQDAVDITHGGGSCGFVGVNNNFANLLIANNSVTDQEEPVKFYECQGSGCNWGSSGSIVRANDFQGVHRIGAETQFNNVSSGANFLYDSNDFVNAIKPNAGMWGLSLPQGTTDSRNNLLIANTALSNDKNGKPGQYFGAALEFWGTGTSSNNMLQGIWGSGINFGFGGSPWSINNNIIQNVGELTLHYPGRDILLPGAVRQCNGLDCHHAHIVCADHLSVARSAGLSANSHTDRSGLHLGCRPAGQYRHLVHHRRNDPGARSRVSEVSLNGPDIRALQTRPQSKQSACGVR